MQKYEELRQNMENLLATREEMHRKSKDCKKYLMLPWNPNEIGFNGILYSEATKLVRPAIQRDVFLCDTIANLIHLRCKRGKFLCERV